MGKAAASSTDPTPVTCIWFARPHQVAGSVRFRVTLDSAVLVTGQHPYQLVRQSGTITDHTFKIEFLDPGVQAYAFTFG
jgi:hypothetical protein